jgi:hypothetical protein
MKTLSWSCAPGSSTASGVLVLNTTRPRSRTKWAAVSERNLSPKRRAPGLAAQRAGAGQHAGTDQERAELQPGLVGAAILQPGQFAIGVVGQRAAHAGGVELEAQRGGNRIDAPIGGRRARRGGRHRCRGHRSRGGDRRRRSGHDGRGCRGRCGRGHGHRGSRSRSRWMHGLGGGRRRLGRRGGGRSRLLRRLRHHRGCRGRGRRGGLRRCRGRCACAGLGRWRRRKRRSLRGRGARQLRGYGAGQHHARGQRRVGRQRHHGVLHHQQVRHHDDAGQADQDAERDRSVCKNHLKYTAPMKLATYRMARGTASWWSCHATCRQPIMRPALPIGCSRCWMTGISCRRSCRI